MKFASLIFFEKKRKELTKQLYRFSKAKTLKTLMSSLEIINEILNELSPNELKLSLKEKEILDEIYFTYKIRNTERWKRLINLRKFSIKN